MVSFERLIGQRVFRAPLVPFIPLIAAGIGAGAAIYTQNKAEEAADEAAAINAMGKREAMALDTERNNATMERERGAAKSRELANASAEDMQLDGMEFAAEEEKRRIEQEKLLATQNPELEYAAKFKPGQGGNGEGSTNDFLVPKISNDTGLIRQAKDSGAGGLTTPLAFAV